MGYDLEEIKHRADLERIADALGLQPKRSGRSVVCRCPAHNDQGRPNLVLSAKYGAKCFRCGFKGDVITLVKTAKGTDVKAAIEWLADFVGVAPKATPGLGNRKSTQKSKPYPNPAPVAYTPPAKQDSTPVALPSADRGLTPVALPSADRDSTSVALPSADQSKLNKPTWPITIVWPSDFPGAVIRGQWRRLPTGEIEATYNDREELKLCLVAAGAWSQADEINDSRWRDANTRQPALRVQVYEALLSHCQPANNASVTPGAAWLRDHKGISLDIQARMGIAWLQDWAKAADDLKTRFGVEALDLLGLMTRDGTTGRPLDLRFKNHRLIFPFFVTVDGRRSPVYVQARNIDAKDKRYRFDNPAAFVPVLYNADAIFEAQKASKRIFITEGVSDTLTLVQEGYYAVGVVGSQGFKPEWVKHFDGLDVYVIGDADEAGRDFNQKVKHAFTKNGRYPPKIVKLPEGQDVTDFFMKQRLKEAKQS